MPRLLVLVLIPVAIAAGLYLLRDRETGLVVYCAHDAVHAEALLAEFTRRTGIPVSVKHDGESAKSLGLVERILRENGRPEADLFWNNELLGTLLLAERGLLDPWQGSGWQRMPAACKDPEGRWCGFAARLRVWAIDPAQVPDPTPEAIANLVMREPTQVAFAKPLYGTTRTHYTLLWQEWGGERVRSWHASQRANGRREAPGNGDAVRLVERGEVAVCATDTDDWLAARERGKDLLVLPVRLPSGRTIVIPNTVMVLAGAQRPAAARQLADFLLSAEAELALARGRAGQIPLGPYGGAGEPELKLGGPIHDFIAWAKEGADLTGLGPDAAECLAWLKQECSP